MYTQPIALRLQVYIIFMQLVRIYEEFHRFNAKLIKIYLAHGRNYVVVHVLFSAVIFVSNAIFRRAVRFFRPVFANNLSLNAGIKRG